MRLEQMQFEYKVVPAPTRGVKAKGLKTPTSRYANALSQLMNELAAEGWEYQRAETLPSEERSGLTGRTVVEHNVLIFRRAVVVDEAEDAAPESPEAPAPLSVVEGDLSKAPKLPSADAAQTMPEGETRILFAEEREDDKVE
jgi:hypothetical protein